MAKVRFYDDNSKQWRPQVGYMGQGIFSLSYFSSGPITSPYKLFLCKKKDLSVCI